MSDDYRPTVKGQPMNPGCHIDGKVGQFGSAEVVLLADRLLGTDFAAEFPKDENGNLAGSIGPNGVWDIGNDHTEAVVEVAGRAEAALNEATEGGSWGWEDGEFFLREEDDDDDGLYVCNLTGHGYHDNDNPCPDAERSLIADLDALDSILDSANRTEEANVVLLTSEDIEAMGHRQFCVNTHRLLDTPTPLHGGTPEDSLEAKLERIAAIAGIHLRTHILATIDQAEQVVGRLMEERLSTTNPFALDPTLVPDAGGYDVFAVMDDGDVLCRSCVVDPTNPVHDERQTPMTEINGDGWAVVGFDHTGNMEEPDHCSHCNKEIA